MKNIIRLLIVMVVSITFTTTVKAQWIRQSDLNNTSVGLLNGHKDTSFVKTIGNQIIYGNLTIKGNTIISGSTSNNGTAPTTTTSDVFINSTTKGIVTKNGTTFYRLTVGTGGTLTITNLGTTYP